jgi:hypothetical protein
MSASREAFDLFHPACRRNFRDALGRKWRRLSWWKMVASDTFNRVCTKDPTP